MQLRDFVMQHPLYGSLPCQVPFSMYQVLTEAGKIKDPFDRDNELSLTALSEEDYSFETQFEADAARLALPYQVLRLEGVDTLCALSLNGIPIGKTYNMHRTWQFDIAGALRPGTNVLRITFHSPVQYMREQQNRHAVWGQSDTMEGFAHIRKASYMFGWDWAPKLPDVGIFRPVTWLSYQTDRLEEVRLRQHHRGGQVKLLLDIRTRHHASNLQYHVAIHGPEYQYEADLTGPCAEVLIDKPQLWWPNGLGEQPLYTVCVSLVHQGAVIDTWQRRIGLRTLTISTAADRWGSEFCFVVNGVKVFAMGADYVPEDSLLGRITPDRTRRLIDSCRKANFNSIRVWGGGGYPSDAFFDACDEAGLIVWQDFMFACVNVYMSEAMTQNIRAEVIDNLIRIRDHASLGLLCGNNEMEDAVMHWDNCRDSMLAKMDYLTLYEHLLPDLCAAYAPDTFYWPSSPSSGGGFDNPQDENRGDAHYWGAWHGSIPFESYRQYYFRFCSEFGFESYPSMKTIQSFTRPADRNPFSPVMMHHQKCTGGNAKILSYASEKYPYPYSLEDFVYVSQLLQAEAIRCGVEHFRRHRGRCMGAIYWQLNDCWPVSSWSSVDYFGRWKALMYHSRRFFAPILLSAVQDESSSVTFNIANETPHSVQTEVRWTVYGPYFEEVASGTLPATAAAFSARDLPPVSYQSFIQGRETERYLCYQLWDTQTNTLMSEHTLLFCLPKEIAYPQESLPVHARIEGENGTFTLTLSADSLVKDLEIDFHHYDTIFSDNFFDLARPGDYRIAFTLEDTSVTAAQLQQDLVFHKLQQLSQNHDQ